MKFGGTSVGSPARMKEVARLVTQSGEPVFVVLSAMSGTTNELVEMSNRLYKKNTEGAHEIIDNLEQKYLVHINELYSTEEYRKNELSALVHRRPLHIVRRKKHSSARRDSFNHNDYKFPLRTGY